MTLRKCLLIVIGENDNKFPSIVKQVDAKYRAHKTTCVHAPIGLNTIPTTNDLYEALSKSDCEFVVVVKETELDNAVVEAGVEMFDEEHISPQKPLLRKGIGASHFEWYGHYDFATAVVIAKRNDLFNVLQRQLSPDQ